MFQTSSDLHKPFKRKISVPLGPRDLYRLENVSVQFGKINALQNIDFKIERGEIIFITGASGAGKTTLLRVLAGTIDPDGGRIETALETPKRRLFASNIFQDLRLLPHLTCKENLFKAYDKNIYRSKQEFEWDIQEFARLLGITDRLHLKIDQANGGLKHKIAFARAMLTRPDIVLADEPTAGLDYDNAKKIYDILHIYNVKRELTIIWASHNKDLIKKFTGRTLHLEKGKLIYSGHACFI